MKLSPHLDLSEIERSSLASYHGIDNSLPPEMLPTWKRIAEEIFEPLREVLGVPIFVTSGYRCPALAKVLHDQRGFSFSSQHSGLWRGEWCAALDLWHPEAEKRKQLIECVIDWKSERNYFPFDQAIYEFGTEEAPDWVHVSFVDGPEPRREVLRSYREESPIKIRYERI